MTNTIKKGIAALLLTACLVILAACGSSNKAPFQVGSDSCEATASDASAYSPTFTVNMMIVGANEDVLYNGKVTLTSNTMWCYEFLEAVCEAKGFALEGVENGNITRIGDYPSNVSKNLFWFYDLNGEESLFGVDHLQLRDEDYLKFYYKEYEG